MATMTRNPRMHQPTEETGNPGHCTCGLQMTRFNWRHQDPDNATVILMDQRTQRAWYGDLDTTEDDTPHHRVS